MPYGKFESVEQVARLFSVKVNDAFVAGSKAIELPTPLVQSIRAKLLDSLSFRNEATICNKVITPILNAVAEQNKPLNIWIEEPFYVDQEKGLVGEPDYPVAPKTKYGDMGIPPLCCDNRQYLGIRQAGTTSIYQISEEALSDG